MCTCGGKAQCIMLNSKKTFTSALVICSLSLLFAGCAGENAQERRKERAQAQTVQESARANAESARANAASAAVIFRVTPNVVVLGASTQVEVDGIIPSGYTVAVVFGSDNLPLLNASVTDVSTINSVAKRVTGDVPAAPAGTTAGPVDLVVLDLQGNVVARLPASDSNALQLVLNALPAPVPDFLSPNSGSTAGGDSVTLTGSGFQTGATVSIGGKNASNVQIVSDIRLTFDTPTNVSGSQDVVVSNPDGQVGTLAGGFTYNGAPAAPPTLTAVMPNAGPLAGGTNVTLTGSGYIGGSTSVTFNGVAATNVSVASATSLTCDTPASGSSGLATVVVNNGTSSVTRTDLFTYQSLTHDILLENASVATVGSTTQLLWNFERISGSASDVRAEIVFLPSGTTTKSSTLTFNAVTNETSQVVVTAPVGTTSYELTIRVNGETVTLSPNPHSVPANVGAVTNQNFQ